MNHAVVIDFETANGCPSSVCSVGIVIVRDGEVVDSFYSKDVAANDTRTLDEDTIHSHVNACYSFGLQWAGG